MLAFFAGFSLLAGPGASRFPGLKALGAPLGTGATIASKEGWVCGRRAGLDS